MNHTTLFARLGTLDRTQVFLNIGLLMVIASIPFPTGLLATYIQHSDNNADLAAALYGLTMTVMGLIFTAMWWRMAIRTHLLAEGRQSHQARSLMRRSLLGPLIYVAATALSALSAPIALVGYAAVAVYFAIPGRGLTPPDAASPPESPS